MMTTAAPTRRSSRAVLLGVLVLLVALFTLLLLITPLEIDSEWARRHIEPRVSEAAGGRFTYERLELSILPRIGVAAFNATLDREELVAAAETVAVFPRMWPLLRGAFQPAAIRVTAPDIRLREAFFTRAAPAAPIDLSRWGELAAAALLVQLPQVDIDIIDGRTRIPGPGEISVDVTSIQAELRLGGGLQAAELSCESNLWKRLRLKTRLAAGSRSGAVDLEISDFTFAPLLAWAFPVSAFEVVEGRGNLILKAASEGPGRVQASLAGDTAHLRIRRAGEETEVAIDAFAAEVDLRPGRLSVSVPKLVARRPLMEASANLVYDEALSPRFAVGLEGRAVDVEGVRRAALALLPDAEGARELFNVLRGGVVPWIAVNLQGESFERLAHLDTTELRGRLEQGRLFIPGVALDLDEVRGDAVIVDGVLEGSRLSARDRGTQGENGSLRLGLSGADPLFALDIDMRADLKPLPEILARVVKNKPFLEGIGRIEQFLGSARGRLELAGTLSDMQVRVDAADIDLRARHRAIPLPLEFRGGQVHYDEVSLALEGVDVQLGKSRLPGLHAVLGLDGPPGLRASSPAAEIDLAEMFGLLAAVEPLDRLQTLEGSASLQPWEFSGDPAAPESWVFSGAGQVRDLRLTSAHLPEEVHAESVAWSFRGNRILAETRTLAMGATRVHALSVGFDWSEVPRLEFSQGAVSVAVDHLYWLLDPHVGLHERIGPIEPVSGSLLVTGLTGGIGFPPTGAAQPNFSAAIEAGRIHSEHLPADLLLDSGEITWRTSAVAIEHLNARMQDSAARGLSASIDWGPSGAILIRAESLLVECGETYPWLSRLPAAAWLRREIADIQGVIAVAGLRLSGGMRGRERWRFESEATLNHLEIATTFLANPIRVRDGRVVFEEDPASGDGGISVRLDAFQVATGTHRAMASGEIRLAPDGAFLDLSVAAESIVWSEIQALTERFSRRDPADQRPVSGRIELRADDFALGSYQFQPVEAHVTFSPGKTTVEIERAVLCGVVTIGRLDFAAGKIDAFLVPIADNTLLEGTLSCLTGEKSIATGHFNIDGTIQALAAPSDFLQALSGTIEFISENGRILRSDLLARVLSLINITELYRGTLPDMTGSGLEYKRTQISAELSNGELIIHSWTLDGPSLWLGARGRIDLAEETLELFIVVSPFKTFDRIIRSVPLLGYLFGGRLLAIPVQASGRIAAPEVVPMHPAALGQSVLDMVGRALLLPVRIVQPLIPDLDESVDVKGSLLIRE